MPDASSPKRPVEGLRLDGARALFLTQFYRPELIGSGPFCASRRASDAYVDDFPSAGVAEENSTVFGAWRCSESCMPM